MDVLAILAATVKDLAAEGVLPSNLQDVELTSDTSLQELGIDSLGRQSLLFMLEDRLGVTLGDATLAGLKTLGDLAHVAQAATGRV